MKYRYILFIGLLGILFACQPELDDFSVSKGNADFTNYISLGNSLTAGYSNAALYPSGQENSYANILANQFKKAGGGSFAIPMMPNDNGVGITLIPQPPFFGLNTKLILGYKTDCLGETSLSPLPVVEDPDQLELYNELITPVEGPVNNFGVYGAKSAHLLAPAYGDPAGLLNVPPTANPYYVRFASSTISSILGDAIGSEPSFYTLWIGSNDVLGYALSGGIGDTITSQEFYAYVMNTIIMSINATGAKGAVANIPPVSSIPFFNTIPYNGLVITQQTQVDALNAAYAPLGITFALGQNPFNIEDANAPGGLRQIQSNERILLSTPQDSIKCAGWGSQVPIGDQFVLSETELENIDLAVNGYNQTIMSLADQYDLAYVDANKYLEELKTGIITDGVTLTSDFITGNAFSLDGVHLTPQGNAYVANLFINAINNKFGATLPVVSVTSYPANILP